MKLPWVGTCYFIYKICNCPSSNKGYSVQLLPQYTLCGCLGKGFLSGSAIFLERPPCANYLWYFI